MRHADDLLHVASIGAMLGSLVGYLPPIAAAVSIVWGGICIYESKTFKSLVKKLCA